MSKIVDFLLDENRNDEIFEEKADRSVMEEKNKESSKSIKKQINDIKKQQLENIKVNKSQIYER